MLTGFLCLFVLTTAS
uniref:Uncharacterized protein n=1 Tax=Anguilla anguilla TaxID=7936 RepID=A0A0E9V929_ANGAN